MTNRGQRLRAAIEGLIPAAFHTTAQYANNRRGLYNVGVDAGPHRRVGRQFTEFACLV